MKGKGKNKMTCTKEYYLKNREEILIKRKKWYQDNRETFREKQRIYSAKNRGRFREKHRIYSAKYREDNKEIILVKLNIYYNTERGFMVKLWNSIKTSARNHNRINEFKNFDEFHNHWLEQKAKYGMQCPATGVEMTTLKGMNKPGEKCQRVLSNISTDRILSTDGYSPKNLIFTTWEYNRAKCSITPEMAKAFLRIVEERYGR